MEKISAADAQQIFYECAVMLKTASDRIHELEREVSGYRKRDKAMKIAQDMQERGLVPDWGRTPEQAVSHMQTMDFDQLDKLQDLVGMTSPDNPLGMFSGNDELTNHDGVQTEAGHPFVQFLLGNAT